MLKTLDLILRKLKLRKPAQSQDLTAIFRLKYEHFKVLLDSNAELSKIISEFEDKLQGSEVFGMAYIRSRSARAIFHALRMLNSFNALSNQRYPALFETFQSINSNIAKELESKRQEADPVDLVLPYSRVTVETMEWVGGKNANLGEIQNRVMLPVPDGFAVTTRAFDFFLSENDMVDQIAMKKMTLDPNDPESLDTVSQEIQHLIISAPVPESLQNAILSAYDEIASRNSQSGPAPALPRISLRSSALGEDSELSFAGQYLSILNVSHEQILKSYAFVIASLFTPRAISYRLLKGIPDDAAAMSVACIRMVDSVASGVIYSRHPFEPGDDSIIISAVWGLGPYAVDGKITPDRYRVSRSPEGQILESYVPEKPVKLISNPEGGLKEVLVGDDDRNRACLSDLQIKTLAAYALRLEDHFGSPQDIEWALDPDGKLLILQSRPLCTGFQSHEQPQQSVALEYPVLLDSGSAASPGVGCGKAFRVRSEQDLMDFPEGSVLVAAQPSPKYMIVMSKARAIVTDFGSVTGHMASLAREFSVPTLLDTKVATSVIPNGMEITVDANSGKVYKGIIPELESQQQGRKPHLIGTPVYETLKRIAALITPLRLIDPKSPDFKPENCKSLHDIMRFAHELSYSEMFRISDVVSENAGFALKLSAPIPLDLYVIDLGGGISTPDPNARKVKHDRIVSVPFRALLNGMLHEDLAVMHPRPIELRGFFSVMGEQMFNPTYSAERFGDRSYAIISDKYLNFSSRVGYHYGVLDSYCGTTLSKNYITFSFRGGAADDVRRNRRARAIALILDSLGMSVEVTGDRVAARLQKLETAILTEKLDAIGRLLQFSRQMDMLMVNEASVGAIATAFLEENYHFRQR
jgi:pyruvate, water dikinase